MTRARRPSSRAALVLPRREAAQPVRPHSAGSVRFVVAFHKPGSSGDCCAAAPGSTIPSTAAPPAGSAITRSTTGRTSASAHAVSSPQDPLLILETSGCLVLPWLLGVPPQGLPNNIIHPTLGRGIASGRRCFRRVMMSVRRIPAESQISPRPTAVPCHVNLNENCISITCYLVLTR